MVPPLLVPHHGRGCLGGTTLGVTGEAVTSLPANYFRAAGAWLGAERVGGPVTHREGWTLGGWEPTGASAWLGVGAPYIR